MGVCVVVAVAVCVRACVCCACVRACVRVCVCVQVDETIRLKARGQVRWFLDLNVPSTVQSPQDEQTFFFFFFFFFNHHIRANKRSPNHEQDARGQL